MVNKAGPVQLQTIIFLENSDLGVGILTSNPDCVGIEILLSGLNIYLRGKSRGLPIS